MAKYTISTTAEQEEALTAIRANVGDETSNGEYLMARIGDVLASYVAETTDPLIQKDRQIATLEADKASLQAELRARAAED